MNPNQDWRTTLQEWLQKNPNLYFPNDFLPVANPTHLDYFLKYFNQIPKSGLHAKNRQLLTFLRSQTEFLDFDTVQMMYFLYQALVF